ncbi:hypothetical protein H206_05368 [Candidatus Electrothrix aarhusensis]|uniref:Uncharacterized protein n=1 Tax=Candidatus Electrothrix aarhusensis TaxID=1859131 RepID=A0A444J4Q7_9BACT|nr:hypothetical protein H206_05368 [Candidatus Electrothrix aarhusensis]
MRPSCFFLLFYSIVKNTVHNGSIVLLCCS